MTDKKNLNVELHIRELVLHGFDQVDGHRVAAALKSQLLQLLAAQGFPGSLSGQGTGTVDYLDAGDFPLQPQSPAPAGDESMGTRIAHSVYSSLSGTTPARGGKKS
jgi:hypothetical protein